MSGSVTQRFPQATAQSILEYLQQQGAHYSTIPFLDSSHHEKVFFIELKSVQLLPTGSKLVPGATHEKPMAAVMVGVF